MGQDGQTTMEELKLVGDFTELVDIASEKLGGAVLVANDEFFAPKENLLKPSEPIFIEGKYTDLGKWMDGWETHRRRTPGFDWCIIRLGLPGAVLRRLAALGRDPGHRRGVLPAEPGHRRPGRRPRGGPVPGRPARQDLLRYRRA